jgi:hypothetical protein
MSSAYLRAELSHKVAWRIVSATDVVSIDATSNIFGSFPNNLGEVSSCTTECWSCKVVIPDLTIPRVNSLWWTGKWLSPCSVQVFTVSATRYTVCKLFGGHHMIGPILGTNGESRVKRQRSRTMQSTELVMACNQHFVESRIVASQFLLFWDHI